MSLQWFVCSAHSGLVWLPKWNICGVSTATDILMMLHKVVYWWAMKIYWGFFQGPLWHLVSTTKNYTWIWHINLYMWQSIQHPTITTIAVIMLLLTKMNKNKQQSHYWIWLEKNKKLVLSEVLNGVNYHLTMVSV